MPRENTLDELALEFLKTFARMEYSLKAAGFHRGDGRAEADWNQFAREIEEFVANPPSGEVRAAIDFIFAEPPKKQMVDNNQIEWSDIPPETNSRADMLCSPM